MHSLLVTHYLNGAWYPKGGASEIAYHMIPIIEKAGGAVLVRAPVNRILFNDAKEAYGGCDFPQFFQYTSFGSHGDEIHGFTSFLFLWFQV